MNLWFIFPVFLLEIKGILFLPLLILPAYLFCLIYFFYLMPKKARPFDQISAQHDFWPFVFFLVLSLITSIYLYLILGPGMGLALPPLLLLFNLLLPLTLLSLRLINKRTCSIKLWGFSSLASGIHVLSWAVWIMALAGS